MRIFKRSAIALCIILLIVFLVGYVVKSAEYGKLEDKYQILIEDNRALESDISQLSEDIRQLNSKLEITDKKVETLESTKSQLELQVKNLKDDNDRINTMYAERVKELNDVRSELSYLQSGFVTIDYLREWLKNDQTDMHEYDSETFNCEDFARTLASNAKRDGYWIGLLEIDVPDYYDFGFFGKIPAFVDLRHALNFAVIGNNIYTIEPQNDWCDLILQK